MTDVDSPESECWDQGGLAPCFTLGLDPAAFETCIAVGVGGGRGGHLVEVGDGLALAPPIHIPHIDELVVVGEARVGPDVLWPAAHIGQVPQLLVPPVVELGQGGTSTTLHQTDSSLLLPCHSRSQTHLNHLLQVRRQGVQK
jgi:hypothetical protein